MEHGPHTVYPSSSIDELDGIQNVVPIPTPAAGSDWTYTLPAGYYYRVLSGYAMFTTSATVANRSIGIKLTDGNRTLFTGRATTAFTAGLAIDVGYGQGKSISNGGAAGLTVMSFFPEAWFPPGYVLSSSTVNIQATDTYTLVTLWLECLEFGCFGERVEGHRAQRQVARMSHNPAVHAVGASGHHGIQQGA